MTAVRHRWTIALVCAFAIAGILLVIRQPALSQATADFTVLYSAGALVLAGHADRVYDQAWLAPAIIRSAGSAPLDPRLPFNEPLAALVPFTALAALPVGLALRIWQALSVLMGLFALCLLHKGAPLQTRARAYGLIALLASAPMWSTLIEGQVSAVVLLGAGLMSLALLSDRALPALPGAALMAIKPHYLLPYLVVLLALRRPRALAAAAAGAGAVLLSPLYAGGSSALTGMVRNALSTDQVTPLKLSESWGGWLSALLPARLDAPVALALLAAAMAGILILAWRFPRERLAILALSGWVGVLASPHCLPHDLILLAVPAWCAFALHRDDRLPSPVPGLILCDVAVMLDELGPPILIAPLVMTGVLVVYTAAFMRRRRMVPVRRSTAAAA